MESRVRLFGHPVHQMLVVFPAGLLLTSVAFDLYHVFTASAQAAGVSFALIAAGIAGGLLAAPFGLADWLAVPSRTRAKAIGALHGSGNLAMLLLFAASLWLRRGSPEAPGALALTLSSLAAALALVTAWLGGELVDRLGVGVSPHAHVDASSSLHGPAEPPARPAPR